MEAVASSNDDQQSRELAELIECYGDWIRASVRRAFPKDWEDIAQEVVLKLGRSLGRLREQGDAAKRAWISRTIQSVCVDEYRKRRRPPTAETASQVPDDATGAATRAARNDDAARVRWTAWSVLSDRERQILKLRFDAGLSFRQISEILDVPQGSVAGWYSRVMATLRDAFD